MNLQELRAKLNKGVKMEGEEEQIQEEAESEDSETSEED
jgi:hypothetical protein